MNQSESEIGDFYANRHVFITGGSGFLGKVIIEKLLRCCSQIESIHVLIRPRDNQPAEKRIEQLLRNPIFDRIRQEQPEQLLKVIAVVGDVTSDGLGISFQALIDLIPKINVVIHSAATIRFDEPLKRAIDINVAGTARVLRLCRRLPNLHSLVHVSTAYCNIVKRQIEELVYNEDIDPINLLSASEWLNDDVLNTFIKHAYQGRPSSYHYTKAMAERYLAIETQKDSFQVIIVRPSIVTPSLQDPLPGWTDNYYGPTGYFVVSGKGVLRSMLVDKSKICDMIPVDVVANTIICSVPLANKVTNIYSNQNDSLSTSLLKFIDHRRLLVINCVSGSINPITWGEINQISQPLMLKYPSSELFRYPGLYFHSNRFFHQMVITFEHKMPAFFADCLFRLIGSNPILTPVYDKIDRAMNALEYFTLTEWIWKTDNFSRLIQSLNETDKKNFFIDVSKIDWHQYLHDYILGVRRYLLQEDPSTIPSAKSKLNTIYYLTQTIKLIVSIGGTYSAIKLFKLFYAIRTRNRTIKF